MGHAVSYTAGIAPSMARFGRTPGPPHITCDRCGVVLEICRGGHLLAWFLNGKATPGWKMTRDVKNAAGRFLRYDLCPKCKKATP